MPLRDFIYYFRHKAPSEALSIDDVQEDPRVDIVGGRIAFVIEDERRKVVIFSGELEAIIEEPAHSEQLAQEERTT